MSSSRDEQKLSRMEDAMNEEAVLETPLLITLEQAAQRLAISRRTLERLISAGEFPSPLKLGRASRVAMQDVEAFFAQLRSRRMDSLNT